VRRLTIRGDVTKKDHVNVGARPATSAGGLEMAKHEAPQDGTPRNAGIIRPVALSAAAYLRSRAATTTAVIATPAPPGRHSRS
jgi:hypothetical protein